MKNIKGNTDIRNVFLGKTIKVKLIRYNIILIVLIAILLSIFSYITANQKIIQISKISIENHVENIFNRFELVYDEMMNIVYNCTERKRDDMLTMNVNGSYLARKRAIENLELITDYCAIPKYGNYISRLTVHNDSDFFIQAGTSFGTTDDPARIMDADWFDFELNKQNSPYYLDIVDSPFIMDKGEILPIVRPLTVVRNGETKNRGWVLLAVSGNLYRDIIRESNQENEIIIATAEGKRISSVNEPEASRQTNEEFIQEILSQEDQEGVMNRNMKDDEYLIAFKKCTKSGILIIEKIPMHMLKNDTYMLVQTVIIMFLACVLLGTILSLFFTNFIRKPVNRLSRHIKKIAGGDFSIDPSIESEDEIGEIGKVINQMSGQIEQLILQSVQDEKEKGDLEMKMLQAQINPHFLYNTLDSIRWIAVIQKNTGIVKAATALSNLLKNTAKGFDQKVTLKQELDFLNDYVIIEKLKYIELFDLEVNIQDERLYQAKIIKLTLQPLVENAIFSGIEPSGNSGNILIEAYEKDDNLYISVFDDGVGIREDKIKTLLNETEKVKGACMNGIGLPNVERRLKMKYGPDYGLKIESKVNEYTRITIKIPLEF